MTKTIEIKEPTKTVYEINGKKVTFPNVTKDDVTVGMRRKTRNFSEERAQEELIWLVLEKRLTAEELEAFDELTEEEFIEVTKMAESENLA